MLRSLSALAAFAVIAAANPAFGSTSVIGNGLANECSVRTLRGDRSNDLVEVCTKAIELEYLRRSDRARTYVNRAIVHTRRDTLEAAKRDLNTAEKLQPSIGEIYVNRGVILIQAKQYSEAETQTTKGLALGIDEPEKGHYNRAIARERLGDVRGAYQDYRKALDLKPDWNLPKTELARFSVSAPR